MEILTMIENRKQEVNMRVAIPTFEGYEILSVTNIIRCEGAGNYTKIIYNAPAREYLVSRKLRDFEFLLSRSGFIRVHNSHIINPIYVTKLLKSDGGIFEMADGQKIRITREKAVVMERFFEEVERV